MEEKFNLYDNIIADTYTNIASYAYNKDEIHMIFHPTLYSNQVFLKTALLVANFENKKVCLKCKFIDFLKILFYYYSIGDFFRKRCRLKISRKTTDFLDVSMLASFEADAYKVAPTIWEEIWKEYYEK